MRDGSVHSQNGAVEFIRQSVGRTRRITGQKLLLRMDSGHESVDTLRICQELATDSVVKRNLRRKHLELWLAIAKEHGEAMQERPGKAVYRGKRPVKVRGVKEAVFEVVERTVLSNGQVLIEPEIEVAVWYTSLDQPASRIIRLYRDHGTSEQFHSELKTDLDIERLPSGTFATNNLVLQFALFAYNLLRFIGQTTLSLTQVPIRKAAQRRRIRTVIHSIITRAARPPGPLLRLPRLKPMPGRASPDGLTLILEDEGQPVITRGTRRSAQPQPHRDPPRSDRHGVPGVPPDTAAAIYDLDAQRPSTTVVCRFR